MEKWDFDLAMRRLVSVYGEKSFPPDRVSILWNRFHGLDPFKWKEMIDSLIATQRFVPLLNEMETWLSENKSFERPIEKREGPWKSIFSDSERDEMMSFLKEVMSGKHSDAAVKSYVDILNTTLKSHGVLNEDGKCRKCLGHGSLMTTRKGYHYAHRCDCSAGQYYPAFPVVTNDDLRRDEL